LGTVGESFGVRATAPPCFSLELSGKQENYVASAVPFELYGAEASGDTNRSALSGLARAAADLKLGPLSLSPFVAYSGESARSYAIARIIETGAGFPEDSVGFLDLKGEELSGGPAAGLDFSLAGGAWSLGGGAYLMPRSAWRIRLGRFIDRLTWPSSGTGIVYPIFYWGRRAEAFDLSAVQYGGDLAIGVPLDGIGCRLSIDLSARRQSFAGLADIDVKSTTPYKQYAAGVAPDDLPTLFIETDKTMTAKVAFDDFRAEAGLGLRLDFLARALKLRASPVATIAYALLRRRFDYSYPDDPTAPDAERWIESYGFVRFGLELGW
jgi:hypothetical protein